jgi:N-glycosylase/DNA lyase
MQGGKMTAMLTETAHLESGVSIPELPFSRESAGLTSTSLLKDVKWGSPDVLFTPEYWKQQSTAFTSDNKSPKRFRLTDTFRNECVLCVLGGYGIPAETGLLAFKAMQTSGLLESSYVTEESVKKILGSPLIRTDGSSVRYRFASQKSRAISELLNKVSSPPCDDAVKVRNWLISFRGIGLKTGSWIVRNWFGSNQVAILDIHIHRAGLLMGLFDVHRKLSCAKDYLYLERQFVAFSDRIGVETSTLDAVIWEHMRRAGDLVHRLLLRYNLTHSNNFGQDTSGGQ